MSCLGVDVWKIPKPIYTRDWTKSFQDFPMNADIAGVADLFAKNNSWRNSKKRYCFKSSSKDSIESDFVQFNKPPKIIPHKEHRGLIVVSKLFGTSVPGRVILTLHLCAYIYCGWPGILWEVP